MAKRAGDKKTVTALSRRVGDANELEVGMTLYVMAYIDLDSERPYLEVIPWTSIIRWGLFYGLNHRQIEDLITYTRVIDGAILKDRKKKSDGKGNATRTR